MKKTILRMLAVCLLVFLTACRPDSASEPYTETVDIDGQSLLIRFDEGNWSAGTIASDNGEYTFAFSHTAQGSRITIVYPDGFVYESTEMDGAYATPAGYDPEAVKSKGYVDGFSLRWSIEHARENGQGRRGSGPSPLLAAALLGLGAWNLLAPKSVWRLCGGWRYRNAEPSKAALVVHGLAGALLLFLGAVCLLAQL